MQFDKELMILLDIRPGPVAALSLREEIAAAYSA